MSRRRNHRAPVAVAAGTVLAGISAWEWSRLHEPMHAAGFAAFEVPVFFFAVLLPAVLTSAAALPMLLVPNGARIWWRHGQDHRPAIPVRLRRAVGAADRHRCCYCGAREQLQVDHIRPWSRGGLSALWNLALLCGKCNRVKSNYWVARDGYVFYRSFPGSDDAKTAAAILAYEKRHRWNPGRWIRAGWSLA